MQTIRSIGLIIVGFVFLTFDIVLRIFVVVCAIFSIFVMVGLMTEWTKTAFRSLFHATSRKKAA